MARLQVVGSSHGGRKQQQQQQSQSHRGHHHHHAKTGKSPTVTSPRRESRQSASPPPGNPVMTSSPRRHDDDAKRRERDCDVTPRSRSPASSIAEPETGRQSAGTRRSSAEIGVFSHVNFDGAVFRCHNVIIIIIIIIITTTTINRQFLSRRNITRARMPLCEFYNVSYVNC